MICNTSTDVFRVCTHRLPTSGVMKVFGEARGARKYFRPSWGSRSFWLWSRRSVVSDADWQSMEGNKRTFFVHCLRNVVWCKFSWIERYVIFYARYFVGFWSTFNRTFGCIVLINTCFSDETISVQVSVPTSWYSECHNDVAKSRKLHRKVKTADIRRRT